MWDVLAVFEFQHADYDSFIHSFQGTKPCNKVFLETPPKLMLLIKKTNEANEKSNCSWGFLVWIFLLESWKRSLK